MYGAESFLSSLQLAVTQFGPETFIFLCNLKLQHCAYKSLASDHILSQFNPCESWGFHAGKEWSQGVVLRKDTHISENLASWRWRQQSLPKCWYPNS